jgi:1-hydroxycarotenoid 3,4-desaturase
MTGGAPPVVIVGGGVGGLALAARLAARGVGVRLLEKEPTFGGKLRTLRVGEGDLAADIDAGPTVLTMREVFDELFRDAGGRLDRSVELAPLEVLARHRWPDGSRLDLFADRARTAAAIGQLAGPREAAGYERFLDHCLRILETVREPFLRSPLPGVTDLLSVRGLRQASALSRIDATRTLWSAISSFFTDPRLRQLFGRYATYVGSSPFRAPGTLNVIAGVEQSGAWVVRGGMKALGQALVELARNAGARLEAGVEVAGVVCEQGRAVGVRLASGEVVRAQAVVTNGDVADLSRLVDEGAAKQRARSLAPAERSLSAVVVTMVADVSGFPLDHHSVFFARDPAREFADLFDARRVPGDPTVYVCAQDRGPFAAARPGPERLLVLINAPATGDDPAAFLPEDSSSWATNVLGLLRSQGLSLSPRALRVTTPRDFERLNPGTGGALYGPASHGLLSAFSRPPCRTPIAGLYAVGGSAHPGAGVPMVALSARIAETILFEDLGATWRSRLAATPGGTSTASATAGITA